jgi:putative DNA primase/helicase
LPMPVRGGSLEALKRVLNVAEEDFPLPVGWLLQTWNPIGPYPLIDISGKSGVGKTLTLEMLLRAMDPNSAGVRKPPSKIQDVFIAAKNNWLIGYDNMSTMPKNLSDAFCQLATGITDATRSHYTNDEEHVITVERPFIVSGIAQHLTERSDLASRAVKLYLPSIRERAGRRLLRKYFAERHGEVLGKFLDGLVGALRDSASIRVANPARLIEFEQFAEAGCRAMGFAEGEFVRAYAANRRDSMLISLEADCVGRAVRSFMQSKSGAKGFVGSPNELLKLLSPWKPTTLVEAKEWPADAPRLTTALDRVTDPLAAIGIECVTRVDRRNKVDQGGQRDIILRLA